MKNGNLPDVEMNIDKNAPKYKPNSTRNFNEILDDNNKLKPDIDILYIGASEFSNLGNADCYITELGQINGIPLYKLKTKKFYTYELKQENLQTVIHIIGIV